MKGLFDDLFDNSNTESHQKFRFPTLRDLTLAEVKGESVQEFFARTAEVEDIPFSVASGSYKPVVGLIVNRSVYAYIAGFAEANDRNH